jgi:hypothetical protein
MKVDGDWGGHFGSADAADLKVNARLLSGPCVVPKGENIVGIMLQPDSEEMMPLPVAAGVEDLR